MVEGVQRLPEREEVPGTGVPGERLPDGRFRGRAPDVPVRGELRRRMCAGDNRPDGPQARDPRNVREHVIELAVHLGERLLHVLGVGGRQLDQAVAVPEERPHRAGPLWLAEGSEEEADRVQVLGPLAVWS